jgi:hypothetical protein
VSTSIDCDPLTMFCLRLGQCLHRAETALTDVFRERPLAVPLAASAFAIRNNRSMSIRDVQSLARGRLSATISQ